MVVLNLNSSGIFSESCCFGYNLQGFVDSFFGYIDNGLMILYAAVGQFEGLFENGWYCITGFGFFGLKWFQFWSIGYVENGL